VRTKAAGAGVLPASRFLERGCFPSSLIGY